ncbi:MAG: homocysteine S-methyltransferase family protein, partial [Defluviitaleaceae bacterium]|nr:homocysteine S-methyltransferase family protein [Defluviitaleaceae bacterium]
MKPIFFDGAVGTILQNYHSSDILSDMLNIKNPDIVMQMHKDYINAGCDIIKTNTLNANRLKLEKFGLEVSQIVSAGVEIAHSAAKNSARDVKVALTIGSLGKLLAPFGDLDFEDAIEIFAEIIEFGYRAKADAKFDMILIETMNDTYEIKAAM